MHNIIFLLAIVWERDIFNFTFLLTIEAKPGPCNSMLSLGPSSTDLLHSVTTLLGFTIGSVVKNLPANETQETYLPSLGQEDPMEKEMATHSSILA